MSATRKCLVWDLDNTVWNGICLEGDVTVRESSRRAIEELDRRGILHSIASRGESEVATRVLEKNRLQQYFLAPRINWLPKPTNLIAISNELDIALDAMAFIDDEPFEREQVEFMLPEVVTLDSARVGELASLPEFSPPDVTPESSRRRYFYKTEASRKAAEGRNSSRTEFLRGCEMELRVRRAREADVPRILELMSRTHQLNTTGLQLSRAAVREIIRRALAGEDDREILVAELEDRFGSYGTVGIALADGSRTRPVWVLDYFAMSCRVLGRGVERAFLGALLRRAAERGYREIDAHLRVTGRNRMMRALYQLMGLRDSGAANEVRSFRRRLDERPAETHWVTVR